MSDQTPKSPFLILASKSAARIAMLQNAGLNFETCPANIDEDSFKNTAPPKEVVQILANEKSLYVSKQNTDAYVIGADQILLFEDNILSKTKNINDARVKLRHLRGKTHTLISSVTLAKNNEIIWSYSDEAHLTMHDLHDDEIERYIEQAGDVLTACVGAYALESVGVRLFQKIKGDYFTILGMPLLPLLNELKTHGFSL